jgi:hypothetical protein
MNASSLLLESGPERREDFPVDSFRHLEGYWHLIRRIVMARAAQLADRETPEGPVYTVTRDHVAMALRELLSDWETCRTAIGL